MKMPTSFWITGAVLIALLITIGIHQGNNSFEEFNKSSINVTQTFAQNESATTRWVVEQLQLCSKNLDPYDDRRILTRRQCKEEIGRQASIVGMSKRHGSQELGAN